MIIRASQQTEPVRSIGGGDVVGASWQACGYTDFLNLRLPRDFDVALSDATLKVVFYMSDADAQPAFLGGDLLEAAVWRTLEGRQTTCICPVRLVREDTLAVGPLPSAVDERTEAAMLLERIQVDSGLTLEQIAPLVGVSRRTLQTWRAGGPISGRKADRLRAVAEVIESLAGADQEETRLTLFSRAPGGVNIYGLLREGRFATALARVSGEAVSIDDSAAEGVLPPTPPLTVRLGLRQDGVAGPAGQLDARRVRRIRRG